MPRRRSSSTAAEIGGCCTTRTCRRRTSSTTFMRLPLNAPPTDPSAAFPLVSADSRRDSVLSTRHSEHADATTALRAFPEAERRGAAAHHADRGRDYGRDDHDRVALGREPREFGCHYFTPLLESEVLE